MFGRRALARINLQPALSLPQASRLAFARTYAKGSDEVDIINIPLKSMGVLTDFYVPPKLSTVPIKAWPRVILRSIGSFGLSTYFVGKFKNDTKLKLKLVDWKELALERYVKTNKIFAAACSQSPGQRRSYIQTQLDGIVSTEVKNSLAGRASSFPQGARLEWNLKKIEKEPLVKIFQIIPDKDEVVAFLQLIIKLETRQEMVVHGENVETKRTERLVTDYVVMTLNPYTDEMIFAGTIFAAGPYQKLRPQLDGSDMRALFKFQRICADIYRSPPAQEK
ncbi:hypothetical protein PUMCH_000256 [Australozyma saopauloensis]|uniref:MBA1-like protein n=1 Tax=Australozyma saopauloensis TaxID=291208 RepID=A0AAX4H3H6_9ASCO|nr:hypothetical protein PUMCH_000256 [[Candida] saopauloensis]